VIITNLSKSELVFIIGIVFILIVYLLGPLLSIYVFLILSLGIAFFAVGLISLFKKLTNRTMTVALILIFIAVFTVLSLWYMYSTGFYT